MKFNLTLIVLSACLTLCIGKGYSQELNCQVQINSSQIQGSDKSIFTAMERAIFEFVNNRQWTPHVYDISERIEATILININERVGNNGFKASIQLQSSRPVHNSSYNSTLLNHLDKDFDFTFSEFEPLEYSETTHLSNLTSVLAFYAYIILALDYDSYALMGGEDFFRRAQTIVSNAQNAPETGWKAPEDNRNRYWLVQKLLQRNFAPYRTCIYNYHRLGFDIMSTKLEEGRAQVLSSLKLLEKIYQLEPNSFHLQIFMNAKSEELIKLFSDAFPAEKSEATSLLTKFDLVNSDKYAKIVRGR